MKRIILFLATNIAVLLVLSVVVSVLGLDRWLMADGIDYTTLLVFSAVMGFGGSFRRKSAPSHETSGGRSCACALKQGVRRRRSERYIRCS